jgi:hypothetical protein
MALAASVAFVHVSVNKIGLFVKSEVLPALTMKGIYLMGCDATVGHVFTDILQLLLCLPLRTSETWTNFYHNTCCHIPQDSILRHLNCASNKGCAHVENYGIMKGKLLSVVLKTTQKHNIKFETQNP